jgi:tetratricopeptide (TPR) repeat protein
VDALRLSGNVAKARELVGSLGADASQPETAYVLAALDLAESSPTWPTVVDRLRTAAAAERGAGRARAALVYALASSGANDDASAELAKLDSSATQGGLAARLRAFVQEKSANAPAASGVAGKTSSPTVLAGAVQPKPPGAESAGEASPKGDFRKLLEDASAAKRSGDLTRADALYRAAREQQPNNVEALAGLGDVARARGDSATAVGYYENVLHQNPTYLPALIGSADLKWAAGDKVGALFLYRRVVNQTDPGTPYGQRAAARIAESQSAGTGSAPAVAPAPEKKPAAEPPAPKTPPPAQTPSDIDTSDLPGFK